MNNNDKYSKISNMAYPVQKTLARSSIKSYNLHK